MGVLSILLCMSFPITFSSGFHFDLRQIPFILGSLYGGYRVAIWQYLSILLFRYLLGGDEIYVNVLVISLILLLVPLLKSKYSGMTMRGRAFISMGLVLISGTLTMLPIFMLPDTPDFFSMQFIGIQVFGMWLATYLVETLRNNIKMRDEIIKAEKTSLISQLSASISHEVKNPLTAVRGLIQILDEFDFPEEKKKELSKVAMSELDRALMILSDYLSLSKDPIENKETLDIVDELKYVIDVMTPYANMQSVEIHMNFQANSYYVSGERQKFRQCLINIVKNGIEAISGKGEVRISTFHSENQAFIRVSDTGCGMTLEQIQRLGTPYYSTKEKGTGIGMMVVYNIINSMNGQIEIRSEKEKGTCFSISFPLDKNI